MGRKEVLRLQRITEGLAEGKLELEDYREELETLAGPEFHHIVALIEADRTLAGLENGSIEPEEAYRIFREHADRHPAVAAFFMYCAIAALRLDDYGQGLGYLALYWRKRIPLAEEGDDDKGFGQEGALAALLERLDEEPELLETSTYLEDGDDHLVGHFLAQHLVDEFIYPEDEQLIGALEDRLEELTPLFISMLDAWLGLGEMGGKLSDAGLEALIAVVGLSGSLEALPVLVRALTGLLYDMLAEVVLALARLGERFPEEVSRELRRVAADGDVGEAALAALDALGLLWKEAGNLEFLLKSLDDLDPKADLHDEMFMFLAHALLSSREEEAAARVAAALERHRAALKQDTLFFVEDYLAHYREIELGCRIEEFKFDTLEDLVVRPLTELEREGRLTLTMMREDELKTREIERMRLKLIEEQMKGARNLPCRCGSGIKFKKCCLPRLREMRDSLTVTKGQGKLGFARLVERLEAFARIPYIREERMDALEEFLGPTGRDFFLRGPSAKTLPEEAVFDDWFLFDRPLCKNGRTPAEMMLERWGEDLPEDLERLLRALGVWRFSLYEVQATVPGERMELRDVFRGQNFEVLEHTASLEAVKWDLIATHVLEFDGHDYIMGVSFKVPRSDLDAVREFVMRTAGEFEEAGRVSGLDEFLRRYWFLVYQQVMLLHKNRSLPTVFTAEGDRLVFSEAVYEVSDPAGARELLAAHPWMEEEEGAGGGNAAFQWLMSRELEDELRKGGHEGRQSSLRAFSSPPREMAPGEIEEAEAEGMAMRGLGLLTLEGTKLLLETQSRQRLELGKREIEKLLAGMVDHVADSFQDQESVLQEAIAKGSFGKAGPAEGAADIPPEAGNALLEKVLAKAYANWLDEPIGYLGGLTPREASATPEGRQRVDQLLKDYENMDEKRQPGFPAFDFNVFREELGIRLGEE